MKNLTNANRNSAITNVLKFQGFEKLTRYELSKVKGGDATDDLPVNFPH